MFDTGHSNYGFCCSHIVTIQLFIFCVVWRFIWKSDPKSNEKLNLLMLKIWLTKPQLRNFFKTGLFLDFFLKKMSSRVLHLNNQFSVFFLEKAIIEFLPKNIYKIFTNIKLFKIEIDYRFLGLIFVSFNIIALILLFLI